MARHKRRVGKRNQGKSRRKSPQEVLAKALNHPIRVKTLTILSKGVASPKDIADQTDIRLSRISYHVRVLHEFGLIEIVEEKPVRGSVAHYYKAIERPLIDNPDWQELDPKVRTAFSGYVIEVLMSDAARSLAAGIFDRRDDRHLSRTLVRVDDEGWRKVSEIQAEADARILKAQAAAAERMNDAGSKAIHAVVGMLCFEVLPSPESLGYRHVP